MPWSHTAPADAARTSTAARLKQMSWALGVLSKAKKGAKLESLSLSGPL